MEKLGSERRGASRLRPMLTDVVWRIAGDSDGVLLVDASRRGFRIRTLRSLEVGAMVVIQPPGSAELPARVRWHRGHHYGCSFLGPISAATLSDLLSSDTLMVVPPAPVRAV